MAGSGIDSGDNLAVQQWEDKLFVEAYEEMVLKPFMGTDPNAVIQVKENLNKFPGDQDTFGLRMNLDSEGLEDDADLEGNEESMVFHDFSVTAKVYKNAIRSKGQVSERRSAFSLRNEARGGLKDWLTEKMEILLFRDYASIDGVIYGSATEAQKDAWNAANSDRVLFGEATSNQSGDNSADLANIDGTNDVLKTGSISLAKRLAQLASPKIRPVRVLPGHSPMYVLFAHPYATRDLKESDTTWQAAQRDAMPRGLGNVTFSGGQRTVYGEAIGMWDGVMIVESENVPLLDNVGASSIDVAHNFLVGAQSICFEHVSLPMAPKRRIVTREKLFQYDEKWGVAIFAGMAHGKTQFNSKDHGVVSVFTAAVAD